MSSENKTNQNLKFIDQSANTYKEYQFRRFFVTGIDDYLAANDYWNPSYHGGLKVIFSSTKLRLKKAIQTNYVICNDQKRYFTDVIIKFPAQKYSELEILDPALPNLKKALEELHTKTLKGEFLDDRKPSYSILPSNDITDGEAEFLFGPGVFAPGEVNYDISQWIVKYRLNKSEAFVGFETEDGSPLFFYKKSDQTIVVGRHPAPLVMSKDKFDDLPFSSLTLRLTESNELKLQLHDNGHDFKTATYPLSAFDKTTFIFDVTSPHVHEDKEFQLQLIRLQDDGSIGIETPPDAITIQSAENNPSEDKLTTGETGAPTPTLKPVGLLLPELDNNIIELFFDKNSELKEVNNDESCYELSCNKGVWLNEIGGGKGIEEIKQDYITDDLSIILSGTQNIVNQFTQYNLPTICLLRCLFSKMEFPLPTENSVKVGRDSNTLPSDSRLKDHDIDLTDLIKGTTKQNGDIRAEKPLRTVMHSRYQAELKVLGNGLLEIIQKSPKMPILVLDQDLSIIGCLKPGDINSKLEAAPYQFVAIGRLLFEYVNQSIRIPEKKQKDPLGFDPRRFKNAWINLLQKIIEKAVTDDELVTINEKRKEKKKKPIEKKEKNNIREILPIAREIIYGLQFIYPEKRFKHWAIPAQNLSSFLDIWNKVEGHSPAIILPQDALEISLNSNRLINNLITNLNEEIDFIQKDNEFVSSVQSITDQLLSEALETVRLAESKTISNDH